jgi:TorA maturation chaperone TorD
MVQHGEKRVLRTVHSARDEFYSFLCRVFGSIPDKEFYRILSEMPAKLGDFIASSGNQDMLDAEKGIKSFLDERSALSGRELLDFELEVLGNYTAMFRLTKSIPMDESFYTSPECREKGKAYEEMIALFRRYGIRKIGKIPENEDFVSYEFLFMSKLACSCSKFAGSGKFDKYEVCLKEQVDFHTNHFDRWIYHFFELVIASGIGSEKIYKHLARLGRGFLKEDKLALTALVLSEAG